MIEPPVIDLEADEWRRLSPGQAPRDPLGPNSYAIYNGPADEAVNIGLERHSGPSLIAVLILWGMVSSAAYPFVHGFFAAIFTALWH